MKNEKKIGVRTENYGIAVCSAQVDANGDMEGGTGQVSETGGEAREGRAGREGRACQVLLTGQASGRRQR